MPPTRVAHAMGAVSLGSVNPSFFTMRPPTPVMTKASTSLAR